MRLKKRTLQRTALRPESLRWCVLYLAQFLLKAFALILLLYTRVRYLLSPRLFAFFSDELINLPLNLLNFGQFADLRVLFLL
jgi:hypothetical protein